MKPTNAEESGCSPISSNCVIWQGPDIECIGLCKGDTVSDVVYKLGTELCELIDTFKLSNYDFACLLEGSSECAPEDFAALIQLIIDAVCALQNIPTPTTPGTAGCPDCVVSIAACFHYENPQGDTVTTMQLTDYVTAIGNRVCELVSEINTINLTLVNHDNRITALETATTPDLVLPRITPVCVLPAVATDMDEVLSALESQFCELIGATGGPIDIYGGIAQQCPGIDQSDQLAGSGTMGTIPGWVSPPTNLADTINNIWLTICDMRSAILNIQTNCCSDDCDGINVTLTATVDANDITIYFAGVIPVNFAECAPTGTLVTITDATGGSTTASISVIGNLNNAAGYTIDLSSTPVNPADNLTVSMTLCLIDNNTGTQCESVYQYLVSNTTLCPVMNLTPGLNDILYQFNWLGGAATFIVKLYDSSQTVILQSQTTGVAGPLPVSGTFAGLTSSTPYFVLLTIQIGENETTCPFYPATTTDEACTPPFNANAVITIP
jgi:hypothetical protein